MADDRLGHIAWRTSSRSGDGGGQCVQVAALGRLRLVRDSKNSDGPVLSMVAAALSRLVDQIKEGEFDPR